MADHGPKRPVSFATGASPTKPWWRRWFGTRSERAAERFLRALGYKVIARNYTCPLGELDMVATDGKCVIFIEVRSTEQEGFDRPAASVDSAKQIRLTRLALDFLKRHGLLDRPARFDVLALSWPSGQSTPNINHYPDAFPASERWQAFY